MNCPICKENDTIVTGTLYDDRYAYPKAFSLLHCRGCLHKFLDARFSASELGELYSSFYPRSIFNVDDFAPREESHGFLAWLNGQKASTFRWVPKNVRVLDIGCGFGESLGYHRARGCEVWGVEADANIKRVADKYGFNVKVGLFDARDYEKSFFDYVTMDQVIEHVVDPIETMKGIATILKPGGVLVMSTPNSNGWGAKLFGRCWINWHAPYHLQHFSQQSLHLSAETAGFEIKTIQTVTNSRWINYQWIHSLLFPRQGEKSRFWSNSSLNNPWSVKVVFKLFSLLHRVGIDHLLSRFFDALSMGDNYIVVLQKKGGL